LSIIPNNNQKSHPLLFARICGNWLKACQFGVRYISPFLVMKIIPLLNKSPQFTDDLMPHPDHCNIISKPPLPTMSPSTCTSLLPRIPKLSWLDIDAASSAPTSSYRLPISTTIDPSAIPTPPTTQLPPPPSIPPLLPSEPPCLLCALTHANPTFPMPSPLPQTQIILHFSPWLLGTSLRATYVMYPYRESHRTRALSSRECHLYMQYLYTTRKSM